MQIYSEFLLETSEEVGFLHYSDKLLFIDFSVTVSISLVDHFLKLLVCHCFSQFTSNSLQIFEAYLSCVIIIKKSECFQDFLTRITLSDLSSHELHKISEFNDSFALAIDFTNHFFNLLFFRLKSKCSHSYLKFFCIDISCLIYMLPTPSVSKRSKASLISCFCYSVSSFLALRLGFKGAFSFLKVDIIQI